MCHGPPRSLAGAADIKHGKACVCAIVSDVKRSGNANPRDVPRMVLDPDQLGNRMGPQQTGPAARQ